MDFVSHVLHNAGYVERVAENKTVKYTYKDEEIAIITPDNIHVCNLARRDDYELAGITLDEIYYRDPYGFTRIYKYRNILTRNGCYIRNGYVLVHKKKSGYTNGILENAIVEGS